VRENLLGIKRLSKEEYEVLWCTKYKARGFVRKESDAYKKIKNVQIGI